MQNIETHLGFVTLLCSQPRSGRVELLWYDAQEFSLILCSIAVRRADVHHLERKRRRCREKYRAERDRDKDTQWVSWGLPAQETESGDPILQLRKVAFAHAWLGDGGGRSSRFKRCVLVETAKQLRVSSAEKYMKIIAVQHAGEPRTKAEEWGRDTGSVCDF